MKHFLDLPSVNNSYYDENLRFDLEENMIFVFGSNLAGRHGKGAAKDALLDHGAIYGKGIGPQGYSYAIPTKGYKFNILDKEIIEEYVKDFLSWSIKEKLLNNNVSFFITAIGTGLAGYKHEEIAPMFNGIKNAWLPLAWKPFMKE